MPLYATPLEYQGDSLVFAAAPPPPAEAFLSEYPGAIAAYSLQDLAGTNPDIVRVRRSSNNAEQNFKAGEITGGALATFCGAGNGLVVSWFDQSGNSHTANQSTQSLQPTIVSSGSLVTRDGLPAINFPRTAQIRLATSAFSGGPYAAPNTIFSVAHYSGALGLQDYLYDGIVTGNRRAMFHSSSNNRYTFLFGPTVTPNAVDTTAGQRLHSVVWASSFVARQNGTQIASATGLTGLHSLTGLTISGAFTPDGGIFSWGSTIQEIIVYPTDKTAEVAAIETTINSHYSIY